jgi:hypothetical protein
MAHLRSMGPLADQSAVGYAEAGEAYVGRQQRERPALPGDGTRTAGDGVHFV